MNDKETSFDFVYYVDDQETNDATPTVSVVCSDSGEANDNAFLDAADQSFLVVAPPFEDKRV